MTFGALCCLFFAGCAEVDPGIPHFGADTAARGGNGVRLFPPVTHRPAGRILSRTVTEEKVVEKYELRRMRVTAYCPCSRCCGRMRGVTKAGANAWKPGVAADWSVLPAWTRIEVPGYGSVNVDDTGSAIYGDRIDLRMTYHYEAKQYGVQYHTVKVYR